MRMDRADIAAIPHPAGGGPEGDRSRLTLLGVLNVLLRQRGLIILCAVPLTVVTVGVSLMMPRTYRARVSFYPYQQSQVAGLSGLAAQLGLSVPQTDATRSPAFYAELIESETILAPIVRAAYDSAATSRSLIETYRVRGESEEIREAKAIRRLRGRLDVVVAARTGVVTVDVDDRSPTRARDIAAKIITEVNEFNTTSSRVRASAEREFSAQRVEEARKNLYDLESSLRDFYVENRAWEGSPELSFQHGQLQRELSLAQQLYAALMQGYEQARIEEVRNIPAIAIVQQPSVPAEPNGRGTVLRGIVALLLGTSIGILLAFLREYLRGSAAVGDIEYVELREHMRVLPRRLLRP
ncbi:MAG: Wzz/FepE/Etk N-terminal domain-containing protein [Gemmatimonadales bacterium]